MHEPDAPPPRTSTVHDGPGELRRFPDTRPADWLVERLHDGDLRPGDVELRFRPLGPFDRSGLDVVIEVRSKWFESRAANRQERADQLYEGVTASTGLREVGVHLSLPVAAWSQGE